jgi:hypothetical protein
LGSKNKEKKMGRKKFLNKDVNFVAQSLKIEPMLNSCDAMSFSYGNYLSG